MHERGAGELWCRILSAHPAFSVGRVERYQTRDAVGDGALFQDTAPTPPGSPCLLRFSCEGRPVEPPSEVSVQFDRGGWGEYGRDGGMDGCDAACLTPSPSSDAGG